jgi:hypothetical protein
VNCRISTARLCRSDHARSHEPTQTFPRRSPYSAVPATAGRFQCRGGPSTRCPADHSRRLEVSRSPRRWQHKTETHLPALQRRLGQSRPDGLCLPFRLIPRRRARVRLRQMLDIWVPAAA